MIRSWNVDFFTRWVKVMYPSSVFLWRFIQINEENPESMKTLPELIKVDLHKPMKTSIFLRRDTTDIWNFREIMEHNVYGILGQYMKSSKTIIDLGANIGLASYYFAATFKDARIFSVEPDSDNFKILSKNLSKLIKSNRCKLLQGAAWKENAELRISEPSKDLGKWALQVEAAPSTESKTNVFQGYTLHQILEKSGFETVDLLKIDIEGAEVDVFQADTEWMKKVKVLAIEFHDDSRERSGFDAVLKKYNFQIVDSNFHTVVATNTSLG